MEIVYANEWGKLKKTTQELIERTEILDIDEMITNRNNLIAGREKIDKDIAQYDLDILEAQKKGIKTMAELEAIQVAEEAAQIAEEAAPVDQ